MDKESLKELNELREYLEIPINEFKVLLALALKYKDENGKHIHEELLYEVIEEAMMNLDYQDSIPKELYVADSLAHIKTIQEAFNRALYNLGYQKVKTKR